MASEVAARVGERIRSRRLELRINQRQLADLIDDPAVSNQHISNWERGVYRPSDRYLAKLAAALQVDVSYLMTPPGMEGGPDLVTFLERIESKLDALLEHFDLRDPGEELEALLEDEVARQAEEPAGDTEEDGRDRAA